MEWDVLMEDKTKLTIGVIITLAMILGSTATYYIAQDDDAYHCEERDIVMICEKLSAGIGTRCYYTPEEATKQTYKVCTQGWVKIEVGEVVLPDPPVVVNRDSTEPNPGKKWLCSPEPIGCVAI